MQADGELVHRISFEYSDGSSRAMPTNHGLGTAVAGIAQHTCSIRVGTHMCHDSCHELQEYAMLCYAMLCYAMMVCYGMLRCSWTAAGLAAVPAWTRSPYVPPRTRCRFDVVLTSRGAAAGPPRTLHSIHVWVLTS